MTPPVLVEHFFRHEYGRLVAVLVRRVGIEHLEEVEDAVQSALMAACESWGRAGVPDSSFAWLFRVAYNRLSEALRADGRHRRILEENEGDDEESHGEVQNPALAGEFSDDLLRMLFVCCDETVAPESQLILALSTLCGFNVREIALRLFTSEAGVYKRLARARERLRAASVVTTGKWAELCDELTREQYASRLSAVRRVLYVLFTEGHLSTQAEGAIRRELCGDAIRLTTLLAEHPVGQGAETFALLSLMHLHAARLDARLDASGALLLLEEQDRALWDSRHIQLGLHWLARSAAGERVSRYHAEAGIAAEHCLAPSLEETRWDRVAEYYELLERGDRSPMHRLNRAIAVGEWQGPAAGLKVLEGRAPPTWLAGSYQWSSVLADLHARCGHHDEAERYREVAFKLAPNAAVKRLLERRLRSDSECESGA